MRKEFFALTRGDVRAVAALVAVVLISLAVVLLTGCTRDNDDAPDGGTVMAINGPDEWGHTDITFAASGDFSLEPFTRGGTTRTTLEADGRQMTDLWVFDFMDSMQVQSLHQLTTDDDFGQPTLRLKYGDHMLCFVTARGDDPAVDSTAHTITWGTPRDTFWRTVALKVSAATDRQQAVELPRVATRLRIVPTDEVPEDVSAVSIVPSVWYYGLDYLDGTAVSLQTKERTAAVAASYAGTAGQLGLSWFGIGSVEEYRSDITVTAKKSDGAAVSTVEIRDAPFLRNRQTTYTGRLFTGGSTATVQAVSLTAGWGDEWSGEW